jgi:uncharacterized protein (DUF2267 family)
MEDERGLYSVRDRLTVEVAAHFAAQLPERLRGVFYDGWNPGRVPEKDGRGEYVARFAREARLLEPAVAEPVPGGKR